MFSDREHEIRAIEFLDSGMSGIDAFPESTGINKADLLQMYMDARNIVRMNVEDLSLRRAAESVCSTCIGVVRCSGVLGEESKKLVINQKTYEPEAFQQYEHAIDLYRKMQEYS
ncbi:hypothetical protein GMA8713_01671 [Grimontia marina]|uniref:Uncharacterized protein n=1 Tax=Grimontia marina TaxID=646534 RepID=A0A128F2H3_9GAMM|nr:hypothetical protein GMA8713_01671 [Grimontia marina]